MKKKRKEEKGCALVAQQVRYGRRARWIKLFG